LINKTQNSVKKVMKVKRKMDMVTSMLAVSTLRGTNMMMVTHSNNNKISWQAAALSRMKTLMMVQDLIIMAAMITSQKTQGRQRVLSRMIIESCSL